MGLWAYETTVGGWFLRVPPLPASDWFPVLLAGSPLRVKDLLEGDDFDLAEVFMSGVTVKELTRVLTEVIETATGRSLGAAQLIAGTAAAAWDVIGPTVAREGLRFDLISIGAALDALYGIIKDHMSTEHADLFVQQVTLSSEAPEPKQKRRVGPVPANAMQYVQTRPKAEKPRRMDPPADLSGQPSPPLEGLAASDPQAMTSGDVVETESPPRV